MEQANEKQIEAFEQFKCDNFSAENFNSPVFLADNTMFISFYWHFDNKKEMQVLEISPDGDVDF